MKEKDPGKMLLEARYGLTKCRELFILSTLILMSSPITKEERVFWGNIWFNASLEEAKITRELVAPAKLKTKAFRTVPAVEDRVRTSGSKFIEEVFALEPKFALELAKAIVNPHIEFTKKIQKEMGVPENALYVKKPMQKENIRFFAHKPTLKKAACQF